MRDLVKNNKIRFFLGSMFLLEILYFTICFFTRGAFFDSIFFGDYQDSFADFFKPLLQWSGNPYEEWDIVNYPALGMMFFKVFHHFIPQELQDGMQFRSVSSHGYVGFIIYSIICIGILLISVQQKLKWSDWDKYLFLGVIMLSAPMMFTLERGNNILFVFVLTLFFCCFYDSENKLLKELAFISLAIASAVKIYPAVFGFVMFARKKWGELVRLVIYGIAFFFLPFLYYGKGSFRAFLQGVLNFTEGYQFYGYNYSFRNFINLFTEFTGITVSNVCYNILYAVIVLGLFLSILVLKERWKNFLACALLVTIVPSVSYAYIVVFLIIPFLELLASEPMERNEKKKGFAGFMMVLFFVLFVPWASPILPEYTQYGWLLSITYIFYFIVVEIMAVTLCYDVYNNCFRWIRRVLIVKQKAVK